MTILVEVTSYGPVFAWLPTRMECGCWVWLRRYQRIDRGRRKRLYLPHACTVPANREAE